MKKPEKLFDCQWWGPGLDNTIKGYVFQFNIAENKPYPYCLVCGKARKAQGWKGFYKIVEHINPNEQNE